MKRALLILVFVVLFAPAVSSPALALPSCGGPSSSATMLAFINSDCFDISGAITGGSGFQSHIDTTVSNSAGSIHIFGTLDSDPFISFGATTTNLAAAPTTFAFLFGTPIVPGFYNTAGSTGGLSLTATVQDTTVSPSAVYPTYISGYGTVGFVPTNLGVDLGTAPCTALAATLPVTTVCGQGSTSNTFAPTFFDNLEALLTYQQSGLSSVASWSGAVTLDFVETVPEPASMTLLVPGMVGAAFLRRRLRRRS